MEAQCFIYRKNSECQSLFVFTVYKARNGDYMGNFNRHDISRDACQLYGKQAENGYDWWWHSFTGYSVRTGKARQFFIEFFLCNPLSGGKNPVFGQTPENKMKGVGPSYLMVNAGTWGKDAVQLHRFFSWKDISVDMSDSFSIHADNCFLNEKYTCGSVRISEKTVERHPEYMSDAGRMSWKLKINKKIAFNVGYGASRLMRQLQLFEMFWHAEGMKTWFEGEIIFNGERYAVRPENCYGYADKNWGKDFTSPWVWLSSNNLYSKKYDRKLSDSVFDIGGGCPKIGPVALQRKLLSAFWYEGESYEFNFSKFWELPQTKFRCRETEDKIYWHIDQSTLRNRMVTDIVCRKSDMLLINYEAPNGKKLHNRLWNGGNGRGHIKLYRDGKMIDEIICRNVGCEYGEYGD